MEQYPSISHIVTNTIIHAYDKLDGSNIRAEWTRKNGFSKFGTRTQLLDTSHRFLGGAIPLFQDKYVDELHARFKKERWEKATVFFEFHGPNSFAGKHNLDDMHDVTLFDIHQYKQGLLTPKRFEDITEGIDTAALLYQGKPNQQFLEEVRQGRLEGMTFEGVICKGGLDNRRRLIQFKVKNQAWLDRLRNLVGDDDMLFRKLA